METSDVIVVGGGLFGPATAYGLRQQGESVVLDDGDDVYGPPGEISGWSGCNPKHGHAPVHAWSRESAHLSRFHVRIAEFDGTDIAHHNDGGVRLLLDEAGEQRRREWTSCAAAGADGFGARSSNAKRPEVMGGGSATMSGVVSKHDGDVNPLKLLRARFPALGRTARTAGSKTFATTAAFSSPRQRTALSPPPRSSLPAVTELPNWRRWSASIPQSCRSAGKSW